MGNIVEALGAHERSIAKMGHFLYNALMPKNHALPVFLTLLALECALFLGILEWQAMQSSPHLTGTAVYNPLYQPIPLRAVQVSSSSAARINLQQVRARRTRRTQLKTGGLTWNFLEFFTRLFANLLASIVGRSS